MAPRLYIWCINTMLKNKHKFRWHCLMKNGYKMAARQITKVQNPATNNVANLDF